ncbi:MAG TPA: patatin-like phospholipase family protein [Ktedonobacterales bacterium]
MSANEAPATVVTAVSPAAPQEIERSSDGQARTAFVLTGGGARGALQIGALRALFERGIQPDLIVGTSIGAWNGAALGLDPTLAGVRRMEAIWRSVTAHQVMLGRESPRRARPPTADQALILTAARRVAHGLTSLYDDSGLSLLAARYLQELTFADLRVPLFVVAASLTAGTRRVFSSGLLAPAVVASSAVPGIFPAVAIDDEVYVDGATIDNVNADVALDAGAHRLFILDIGYVEHPPDVYSGALSTPHMRPVGGPFSSQPHPLAVVIERALQVGSNYRAQRELERIPLGIETHVLRLTTSGLTTTLAFGKASEWVEAGYRAACEQLPALVTP